MNRKFLTFAAVAIAFGAIAGCATTPNTATGASPGAVANHTASVVSAERPELRGPNPYQFLPKVPSFRLTSQTVRDFHPLPTDQLSGIFGVPGGKDISPQLSWSGFPARTKSFVISMYDPQAPTGSGFWHWVVTDVPSTTTSVPVGAGVPDSTSFGAGAFQLGGDAGAARYVGAAPPAGSGVHDYYITVTALDVPASGVAPTASAALLGFTIGSHTIARATLICPTAAK
jgi:Raf kinase inhibitor-like YbhB/YbcL family protein